MNSDDTVDVNRQPELVLCELGPPTHGLESLSQFCLKAHRALKFHKLRYGSRFAMRPSEHKQLSKMGKVPILLVDNTPIPDSTSILEALEKFSSKTLIPVDKRVRASAWLWEDYADNVLGYYVFAARWFDDRNWGAMSEEQFKTLPRLLRNWLPDRIRKGALKSMASMEFIRKGQNGCWDTFQRDIDNLEQRAPESGFWTSPSISVADIALFGMLHCLRSELSAWQMQEINARPRLKSWLDRIDQLTTSS